MFISVHWLLTGKRTIGYACRPVARIITRYTTVHMAIFALDWRLSGSSATTPCLLQGGQWEGCWVSFATSATMILPRIAPGRFLDFALTKGRIESLSVLPLLCSQNGFWFACAPFWPESYTDLTSLHDCISIVQFNA